MFQWIEDQILAFLQRRCRHPENIVAADILEGCSKELEVMYCNRCGAVVLIWGNVLDTWRTPDPNLWRG